MPDRLHGDRAKLDDKVSAAIRLYREHPANLEPMHSAYPHMDATREEFAMIQRAAGRALADLPDHRVLVEQLCIEYGAK